MPVERTRGMLRKPPRLGSDTSGTAHQGVSFWFVGARKLDCNACNRVDGCYPLGSPSPKVNSNDYLKIFPVSVQGT